MEWCGNSLKLRLVTCFYLHATEVRKPQRTIIELHTAPHQVRALCKDYTKTIHTTANGVALRKTSDPNYLIIPKLLQVHFGIFPLPKLSRRSDVSCNAFRGDRNAFVFLRPMDIPQQPRQRISRAASNRTRVDKQHRDLGFSRIAAMLPKDDN